MHSAYHRTECILRIIEQNAFCVSYNRMHSAYITCILFYNDTCTHTNSTRTTHAHTHPCASPFRCRATLISSREVQRDATAWLLSFFFLFFLYSQEFTIFIGIRASTVEPYLFWRSCIRIPLGFLASPCPPLMLACAFTFRLIPLQATSQSLHAALEEESPPDQRWTYLVAWDSYMCGHCQVFKSHFHSKRLKVSRTKTNVLVYFFFCSN